MSDDDGEQSPGTQAEERAPKTRDLADEITPTAANAAGKDDEDFLDGNGEEGSDEAAAAEAQVEVESEVATAFWAAVIYVNVGLLLVALGPMLAFFRGRTQVGAALVVLGGFALYRAYTVYSRFTAPDEDESETDGDAEAPDEDESGAEGAAEPPDDESDGPEEPN